MVLFRPPYGAWRREGAATSVVAQVLNRSVQMANHLGPVQWDIDAGDWLFWEQGLPTEVCVRQCLDVIEEKKRGIVLMHDSAVEPGIRTKHQTLQLTMALIPILKARGYQFVRLDAVPQIEALAASVPTSVPMPAGVESCQRKNPAVRGISLPQPGVAAPPRPSRLKPASNGLDN